MPDHVTESDQLPARAPLKIIVPMAPVCVVALWGLGGLFASTKDAPGTFGDMFGAVNALFSGLAFAGVIITIWLQSRELELQRIELRETRKELAGQKEQMEAQARTLKHQAADANFFRLLEAFRNLATNIQQPGLRPIGADYWRAVLATCRDHSVLAATRQDPSNLTAAWQPIYERYEPALGAYFATLTLLLDFIAEGDRDSMLRWSRILSHQLTPHEMAVIFYHAASDLGRSTLKGYVEEMHLFKHFPVGSGYPESGFRHWYDDAAFGIE